MTYLQAFTDVYKSVYRVIYFNVGSAFRPVKWVVIVVSISFLEQLTVRVKGYC